MELPVERAEWGEVVVFAWSCPRQTITAVNMSGAALAQRTIWIMNDRLLGCECAPHRPKDRPVPRGTVRRRDGEHGMLRTNSIPQSGYRADAVLCHEYRQT